jgi:hypothetical protein
VETLRLLLPGFVAAANLVLFCMAITLAYQHSPLWAVVLLAPAVALILSVLSIFIVALAKVVLIDRFEPTVKPLWCSFVWFNEVVNGMYESIAAAAMAPLMGTPFISTCLRAMGCKIGKWVFIETTLFSEFDLVVIGDYAALNLGSTIQTHLFEDRVMKADYVKIGEGCTVGNMAVVLYGTEMKRRSSLGALSVLMKGEVLPEFTHWIGIPTRAVEPVRSLRSQRQKSLPSTVAGDAKPMRNIQKGLLNTSSDEAMQHAIIFDLNVGAMFRAGAMFTARGFSYSTIKALVGGGIDAPERLLFADETGLRSIPGIDGEALEEIARYRAQFRWDVTARKPNPAQCCGGAMSIWPRRLVQAEHVGDAPRPGVR